MRLCVRARCVPTCFPCSPCVRTYGACVPAHVPAPVARTHARLYVRTYVRALYARAQPRGREGALSIRTYVRAHLRIRTRVPPSLSASRRVCAYVCTHAIPLGPSATPPPARRGPAPHDSHPNLFVSRPSPRTHSDRRSARRWGSSCHAPGAVRTHVRIRLRARCTYACAPGPGRDVALSLRTPVYVRKYVRTYVALHPTLHARACVRT